MVWCIMCYQLGFPCDHGMCCSGDICEVGFRNQYRNTWAIPFHNFVHAFTLYKEKLEACVDNTGSGDTGAGMNRLRVKVENPNSKHGQRDAAYNRTLLRIEKERRAQILQNRTNHVTIIWLSSVYFPKITIIYIHCTDYNRRSTSLYPCTGPW